MWTGLCSEEIPSSHCVENWLKRVAKSGSRKASLEALGINCTDIVVVFPRGELWVWDRFWRRSWQHGLMVWVWSPKVCRVKGSAKFLVMNNFKEGIVIYWDGGRTQEWSWREISSWVLDMLSLNFFQKPKWRYGGWGSESGLRGRHEFGRH